MGRTYARRVGVALSLIGWGPGPPLLRRARLRRALPLRPTPHFYAVVDELARTTWAFLAFSYTLRPGTPRLSGAPPALASDAR